MIDPADPAAVQARAAERLFTEGRARESAVIYREIAEGATEHDVTAAIVAWHNLAVVEQHLGNIEAAEVALLEALRFVDRVRAHPLRGVVLRRLGLSYDAMRNDAKAADLLTRALEDPSSMRCGAIRCAEMAIDLAAIHRRQRRSERGVEVLNRALAQLDAFVVDAGADERELLPWREIVAPQKAPPSAAPIAPYRSAGPRRAPESTTIARILLLEERSALHAARGVMDASIDDGLAALKLRDEIDDRDATATLDASMILARRAQRARRWADAAAILERVRDHPALDDDERIAAWTEHGAACSEEDRFEEAERSFAHARAHSRELSARLVLGLATSRVRRGDGAGALEILEEGRATATTTEEIAAVHHLTAEACLLLGDADRALHAANTAVSLLERGNAQAPRLVAALDALGEASRRKGDRASAAAAFERALSLLSAQKPILRRALAEVTLHVAQLLEDEGLREEAEGRRAHARELLGRGE